MPLFKGDVHIDQALTSMALGYSQPGFVADALFPELRVQKDSDKYFVFGTVGGREVFGFGNEPEAAFAWEDGSDFNVLTDGRTTQSYSCIQYAAAATITESELRNQDAPLNAFRDHANFITERLKLTREIMAATKARTRVNYPAANRTQLSGTSQWSDFSSGVSDPISDVITGAEAIRSSIGRYPNTMVMGAAPWAKLIQHPDVVEILKYTSPSLGAEASVATLFQQVGIQSIHVGAAIKNTADDGATESMSDVWGEDAILAYVAPSPGIGQPSYGYRFTSVPLAIERTALPGKRATLLNAVSNWDFEFVCQDGSADSIGGYLIEDAV